MATHATKAVPGAKPAGSERKYDREAVMAEICERTVSGETLLHICKSDGMPGVSTVFGWLANDVILSEHYTRARTARGDVWAEEIIQIADDSADDFIEHETPDGRIEKRLDSEHVQRSKLRVAARQWVIAKHSPQRYGDRVDVNLDAKVKHEDMTDEELLASMQRLYTELGVTGPLPELLPLVPGSRGVTGAGGSTAPGTRTNLGIGDLPSDGATTDDDDDGQPGQP